MGNMGTRMESPWPKDLRVRLADNLSCLAQTQPDVATCVDNTPIPTSVSLVTGRDGQPTCQLSCHEHRIDWLGGSSMPSVSAPQILAHIAATNANAILPGILTGQEPIVMLDKFPNSSAIFIVEPDPLFIKLAFHLYDYTEGIREGRLVVVTTDDWSHQLCAFFETHPGYELPTQMITVPQCRSQRFALIQQKIEHIGQSVFALQSENIKRIKGTLDAATPTNLEIPRLALIAADARPQVLEEMDAMLRAAHQLGWSAIACRADLPALRHPIERLRAVQQIEANIVISVGGWSHALGLLLPADLSTICWLTSSSIVPTLEADDLNRIDVMVAPTARIKRQLASWPIDADSICVSPPAVDTPDNGEALPSIIQRDESVDVVILADLPDDRPESFGITLSSQLSLWQAMRDVARVQAQATSDDASPQDLLIRAQKLSGVRLKEQAIRLQFTTWLTQQILPTRRAIVAVEALAQAGINFALYGWGWSELSGGRFQSKQESYAIATRKRAINNARVVLVLLAGDGEVQCLLEGLGQAKPVVCRGSASSFAKSYPGLENITQGIEFYRATDELVHAVRAAISSDSTGGTRKYKDAQIQVLSKHTWACRLQNVVQHVARRKRMPISAMADA